MKHLKHGVCIRNKIWIILWYIITRFLCTQNTLVNNLTDLTHVSQFYLLNAKITTVSPHLISLMGSVTLSKTMYNEASFTIY